MLEIEPSGQPDTQPILSAGSTELPRNPDVICLPWTPDSTADEIGRTAVAAVQASQQRRELLQEEIRQLQAQEQAIVLAAKDAAAFSWSGLAKFFGISKSKLVNRYDPNAITALRRGNSRYQERLRTDAAKARQAS